MINMRIPNCMNSMELIHFIYIYVYLNLSKMLKEKIHSYVKVIIYSLTTLFLILACEIGTNNESLNLRSNFSSEDPLIIVDGQEVINRNIIDSLNPEEIERVDVLKDSAAYIKYGDKGKNGVIEIITKNE